MAWTEKMVEDLRIMWKQGLTTGEIGKRLGVSKNSIVGKVHRLQLDARPSPIKKKGDQTENTKSSVAEKKTKLKTEEDKKPSVTKATNKTVQTKEVKETKAAVTPKAEVVSAPKTVPSEKKPIKPVAEKTPYVSENFFTAQPKQPAKNYNGNAKLTDLDNHTCRWPLGDPKDDNFHFCGRKVKVGQTYCDEHAALAYVKPTTKK